MRNLGWIVVAGLTACGSEVANRRPEPPPITVDDRARREPCGLDLTDVDQDAPVRVAVSGTRVRARIQKLEGAGDTGRAVASISGDVRNRRGQVVIPAGSTAELTIRRLDPLLSGRHSRATFAMRLRFLTIQGRPCQVAARVLTHFTRARLAGLGGSPPAAEDAPIIPAGTPIVFALEEPLFVAAR
ncbi:MAG: hypothetical protein HY560_00820 [Gemmatimonadetes bacterium]|nr:hypothetical protein [Gemmatimonadota bacterium]